MPQDAKTLVPSIYELLTLPPWPTGVATSAETAAGVTPVNFYYPAGYVDRYGNNVTPGTTDMSSAFTSAVKVAAQLKCPVRWGATAPYRLNNPVNCTGIHGLVFNDESSGSVSNSAFISINVGHNGHAFDLATSYECTFNNLAIGTVGGSVPKSLFFCARNVAASDAGLHRFFNIRTASNCTANFIYYGYASEQNHFTDCCIQNAQPGGFLFSHNSTNPSSYTSTFVSIATGSQSNTEHRHRGGSYFNFGNSGSHNEYIFQIENAADFTYRDGLWGCAHGGGYALIQGTLSSFRLTFDSIRGEPLGTQPTHGIDVTAVSATHSSWTFNDVNSDASGYFLVFSSGAAIQNMAMRATTTTSGNLITAYNLSDSVIETLINSAVTGQAGGTINNNVFIGGRSNITAGGGTLSSNIYLDNNTATVGIDGDSFTSASTACTGAITASVVWTATKFNKNVVVTLPSIAATATAAASFTVGAALPAAYRPAADERIPIIIRDNGATPNQLGFVFVASATGVMTVFKDIAATATFSTTANGEGLPAATELRFATT